ncbi:MAG: hypothetical protein ACE5E6_00370 [Phycisphaerae bacterium]
MRMTKRTDGVGRLLCAGMMGAVVTVGVARGESKYLVCDDHPKLDNFFTLDFNDPDQPFNPDLVTQAFISTTYYVLDIDPDAGTARFVDYHQDVDPLLLPGGISTGAITIGIVPDSSSGTFDPETGAYTTTELYEIFFEGDLSLFGVESPVVLESTSNGIVGFDTAVTGTILMEWAGTDTGTLENPQNPGEPLTFSYTCQVNAQFAQAGTGDFDADIAVDIQDYLAFRACFTGPTTNPVGSACAAGDFDLDGDIDLDDSAAFRGAYTGS